MSARSAPRPCTSARRRSRATPAPAQHLLAAAQEETDHLAWCAERLRELDSRPSLLNPLWYAGSYAIGALAGLRGDGWNLGFVVETERQVEAHLDEHLQTLPAGRRPQPRILETMKADEARHADHAEAQGARVLPQPMPALMAAASKLMKAVAYRLEWSVLHLAACSDGGAESPCQGSSHVATADSAGATCPAARASPASLHQVAAVEQFLDLALEQRLDPHAVLERQVAWPFPRTGSCRGRTPSGASSCGRCFPGRR